MRHNIKKAILNRPSDQRKALLRSLITSLFEQGTINTTEAKAKALSSNIERIISLIKKQDPMNTIRTLKKTIYTETSIKKAIEYAKATKKTSGFTRVIKTGYRKGDNALMAQISLISNES